MADSQYTCDCGRKVVRDLAAVTSDWNTIIVNSRPLVTVDVTDTSRRNRLLADGLLEERVVYTRARGVDLARHRVKLIEIEYQKIAVQENIPLAIIRMYAYNENIQQRYDDKSRGGRFVGYLYVPPKLEGHYGWDEPYPNARDEKAALRQMSGPYGTIDSIFTHDRKLTVWSMDSAQANIFLSIRKQLSTIEDILKE